MSETGGPGHHPEPEDEDVAPAGPGGADTTPGPGRPDATDVTAEHPVVPTAPPPPHAAPGGGDPFAAAGAWWEMPPAGLFDGDGAEAEDAPQARRRRRRILIGAVAALVLVAEAAGIGIGHAVWRSTSATAPGVSPRPGGGGLFGDGGGPGDGGRFVSPFGPASGGSSRAGGAPADTAGIAAKVNPAVVDINVTFGYLHAAGAGTGIVLTSDGEVLTNNHVINGASRITATDVGNGQTYDATVVGYDPGRDVAVLSLKGASGLTTAKLGDSSKVAVGQAVVAVGNAGGAGGTPSSAGGSVTALDRAITASDQLNGVGERLSGLIEVNAAIQSGDSGGPLVDTAGRVIGMNTAASAQFSFNSEGGQGYAVPINQAMTVVRQVRSGRGTSAVHVGPTAFLGVMISSSGAGTSGPGFFGGGDGDGDDDGGSGAGVNGGGVNGGPSVSGAAVSGTVSGTPAEGVGLAAGDVITGLGGRSVGSSAGLSRVMLLHHPGDRVSLAWTDQSGQSHTAEVTLASGPPA